MENKVVQPETSIKKKRKKMVIDFKDKNKVQEAYIMKAILDRPQAYKFWGNFNRYIQPEGITTQKPYWPNVQISLKLA